MLQAIALRRRAELRLAALPIAAQTTLYLGLLVLLSLVVRTRSIDAGFWIDEGITVGISLHPLSELPSILRQDGSPPLYYALLHAWMELFGTSEAATHALSLVFALAIIPVAFWAATSLFGRRTGWICAALATLNPFLTSYAQETRMYTLVVLLALAATGTFLHAFVFRRRRYVPVLALILALLLLTHNWGLFLVAGAFVAFCVLLWDAPDRRRHLVDGALAFGGAALPFLPWLPTLIFQAAHTGAPWSRAPSASGLLGAPSAVFAGDGSAMALLLAGGAGVVAVVRGPAGSERRTAIAAIALTASTLILAWGASQVAAVWANRYLAVVLGPLLLLAALGLSRGGRLGMVGFVVVTLLWAGTLASDRKSNVADVAAQTAPYVEPGDLVVSTHPEQTPVLHYYLPEGLRYATTLGPVPDPRVMDWRDAVARLRAAKPRPTFDALAATIEPGQRLLLVQPDVRDERAWSADWTELVLRRSDEWYRVISRDRRFQAIVATQPGEPTFKGVTATVYRRVRR